MRQTRMLALGASVLALISACTTGGGGASPTTGTSVAPPTSARASGTPAGQASGTPAGQKPTVKVGSDDFYEAKVMAEIYAQALEQGGYTVERTGIGIGTRSVSAAALDSNQINLKPEYIGSGLGFYAKSDPKCAVASPAPSSSASASQMPGMAPAGCTPTGDAAANSAALQALLSSKGITVLKYSPAVDTNAFVVRQDTATQYSLAKMSDTAAVQDKIKWGLATDCASNPLCGAPGGALQGVYGITQKTIDNATPLGACSQPMADALTQKTVDLGELCSTQPDIAKNGWALLQDDKSTQPADNLAPIVRDDLLAQVDKTAFEKILDDVSAKMDTAMMTKLNAEIAIDKKDVAAVATQWLKDNGFVQ
jgi:osmoprotectant transport system substrate-binding protein